MTADDLYNSISLNLVLLTFEDDYHLWLKDKYKLFQSLIYLAEIKKNQYICHSGYWGLPALRSPVAPIAAPILSSSAGERGLRTNAVDETASHDQVAHKIGCLYISLLF